MTDFPRLQAIVGSSARLRDDAVRRARAGWTGPITRLVEPDDLPRLILDLDTPSFLGDSALLIIRADAPWVKAHADLLAAHVGQPLVAGGLMLVTSELDQRTSLAKALGKAKAVYQAEAPDAKGMVDWLVNQLQSHPQGVDRAREIAAGLVEHLGHDADALLGAIEILAVHADTEPLSVAAVHELFSGTAERQIWDFTGAVFDGQAKKAIEWFHAIGKKNEGEKAESALAALLADLRKQIACSETPDDGVAQGWLGGKGGGSLYYARKRARELGRPVLLRLFLGALQVQRQLRTGGTDPGLACEVFVLHAQRILGRSGR
jgi:DNA polymerase III delta subunit